MSFLLWLRDPVFPVQVLDVPIPFYLCEALVFKLHPHPARTLGISKPETRHCRLPEHLQQADPPRVQPALVEPQRLEDPPDAWPAPQCQIQPLNVQVMLRKFQTNVFGTFPNQN